MFPFLKTVYSHIHKRTGTPTTTLDPNTTLLTHLQCSPIIVFNHTVLNHTQTHNTNTSAQHTSNTSNSKIKYSYFCCCTREDCSKVQTRKPKSLNH